MFALTENKHIRLSKMVSFQLANGFPANIQSGHYQHTSETPLQWRFAGGQMVVRFYILTKDVSPGLTLGSKFINEKNVHLPHIFLLASWHIDATDLNVT